MFVYIYLFHFISTHKNRFYYNFITSIQDKDTKDRRKRANAHARTQHKKPKPRAISDVPASPRNRRTQSEIQTVNKNHSR